VQDARYFRSQAKLCLKVAQLSNDQRAAECFRTSAANYLARAAELEAQSQSSRPTLAGSAGAE
jgi:hypothetical protein